MQPLIVSVGPLANASANNISTTQTPNAGTGFVLNSTLATKDSQYTGSIAGNVLTVTAVASGVVRVGQRVNGAQVTAGTVIVGLGTGNGVAGTYILNIGQTISSTTLYGNVVATLDTPRLVLITTTADDSANKFTVTGTDWAGSPISEAVTGTNNSTSGTVLSYATVTSVVPTATAAGAVTIGTNGVAYSPWVRLDPWANSYISIQCTASGTVNYTLQQTLDDPNSLASPVNPNAMTWVNSSDTAAVGATGTIQTNYGFTPVFARVLLNSGTGTVTATFVQTGVVGR